MLYALICYIAKVVHCTLHCRYIFVSWFVMSRSLAKRACVLLPHTKIFNFYGPTEATIGVSHWLANGGNYEGVSTLPIGPPMANTHLYVLDADLRPVPVGKGAHWVMLCWCLHLHTLIPEV